jgi:Na+/H+-dicarboxylate symporter
MTLPQRIVAGLIAGVFLGLFLGEPAAVLQPLADIYVRLMQMTVLPYLVTALVIAFGQLDVLQAKRLALRGGILLLGVWLFTSAVILCLSLSLPAMVSASFFSNSLTEPHQPFSLTDLYFTPNLFESLSKNIVPAVVLFSCLVGVGLIGLSEKERLLGPLRVWNAAITRLMHLVIGLTPVGVFAIGAVTAGTIVPETLGRLEAYFLIFIAASLLLAVWILPLLVTAVTPFRYAEVAGIARGALLTAFVANNAFIVLPVLIEQSKALLQRHGLLDESTDSTTEVLIPVMFNFPNAGKLLTLMFIPFAAWLSGSVLDLPQYAQLLAVGIPSYFAKAQVALPFLLDLFGLPHDLFQLYIPTTILTGKFDSLVTAVNLLVFALLGAGAMGGFLVFERARVLRALAGIVLGTAVVVLATRALLAVTIDTGYRLDEAVREMHAPMQRADVVVHRDLSPDALAPAGRFLGIAEIRARGSLRIGYDPDNLPMSFFNRSGELVGFDVELATQLAAGLGLRAEFVPIQWPRMATMLEQGVIDVMPGIWYRPFWFDSLRLSSPYFTGVIGLAVRDERRHEFATLEQLRAAHGLRIGIPLDSRQLELSMARYFGGTDTEFVVVEFWKPYFEGKVSDVDAFLMPAEHAAGWSLLYPRYTVVVPQPDPVRIPSAFGVAPQAADLALLIDEWVIYAEGAGIVREAFDYWVLGKGVEQREPRWSIMRNVLGWGE